MRFDVLDFWIFVVLFFIMIFVFVSNKITVLHKVYFSFHICMMLWPYSQFVISMLNYEPAEEINIKLAFGGLSFLGYGWLVFSMILTQRIHTLPKRDLIFLALPAALVTALAAVNPQMLFVKPLNGSYDVREYGPFFWVFAAVTFGYVVISISHLLMRWNLPVGKSIHKQTVLFILGVVILMSCAVLDILVNVVWIKDRIGAYGLMSIGILLSDLCFVLVVQKYKVLEIIPIAQSQIIHHMPAGIIVLDMNDLVMGINPAAEHNGSVLRGEAFQLSRYLQQAKELPKIYLQRFHSEKEKPLQFEVSLSKERDYHLSIHVTPILDGKGMVLGRTLFISDVTKLQDLLDKTHQQNITLHNRNEELTRIQNELTHANQRLEKMAMFDGLTGCYNRRYMFQFLHQELEVQQRYRVPFSLILIDVDSFKEINDTYGHPVGDEVLKKSISVLQEHLRKSDLLARYGGEEFIIYLPHTSKDSAIILAERLRQAVEEEQLETDKGIVRITVSMGISDYDGSEMPYNDSEHFLQALILKADRALYSAKSAGRNSIVVAE